MSGQCWGSVGAQSGQCWGSIRAVSVDTGVGVSSSVEQCRSSVHCRPVSGILDRVGIHGQCRAVSECRSVGVSECRAVSECRSVGWVSALVPGCQVGDSVKQ